ncbi:type IX secretion system membrane protein PorP/SprF [Candidatus Bipolaricaulota bacterium]|nr:type IX secretion system membrane protein PorP/SprF [Candidatus Bipolaricaulota bacterium]
MKKVFPTVVIILMIATPATVVAIPSDDFVSTASLFTVGTGARPLGMGNAFVGLANDENALFYNPAGLAFLEEPGFSSFYTNQFDSFNYGSLSATVPRVGLTYLQLSSGALTERDLYGNSTGEFDYTSRGLLGAYGTKIGEDLSVALQGKAYQVDSSSTAMGYSLTPGLLYKLEPFQLGAVFKNLLASDITYADDHTEPWQREVTIGIAYSTEKLKLDLDIDALLTERGIDPGVARIGAEGTIFRHLSLRAGVTSKLQSSIGLGVDLKNWQFDYSYQIHNELPSSHRVSLTARFGEDSIPNLEELKEKFRDLLSRAVEN